ncbi:MAG: 2-oxoglutarate dehydrogenase E1 component [Verrucomicrobia bacterium]|nr:2-oxoglutarate dehydrogenase E1 component [Verrucomicrobiota bacterium]MBS0646953.1 2-oxoglutarate dehydrogenase E1 component [Verrucomicrobiota bacterium]
MSSRSFSFINLDNLQLIESLYAQYQKDPQSVEPTWRYFFDGMSFSTQGSSQQGELESYIVIDTYRRYGYLKSVTNPLPSADKPDPLKQLLINYDKQNLVASHGLAAQPQISLAELIQKLEGYYCGSLAAQYMHCPPSIQQWIQERLERTSSDLDVTVQQRVFYKLNQAQVMERYLHTKYVGQKRFSLEGAEVVVPMLSELIEHGASLGVQQLVMGMSHRGRLNVLTHILNKPYRMLFSEFEDFDDPHWSGGHGDVKYHKGFSVDVKTAAQTSVHVSLTANPSHLESVGAVVQGRAYAKQQFLADHTKEKVLPVILHGDASLAGQGIVYEIMQLSALPGYSTGGTVHIVIDNQIGFTATSKESRSTAYASDLALTFSSPVFHLNAEDPEACVKGVQLAMEIRQKFHCDVFLNLLCYRRYGHNESDEPVFTQPHQYQKIQGKTSSRDLYRDVLLQKGVLKEQEADDMEQSCLQLLEEDFHHTQQQKKRNTEQAFGGVWKPYQSVSEEELFSSSDTAVSEQQLKNLAQAFSKVPEGFSLHSKLKGLVQQRFKRLETGVDWALAEQLAFASLLVENVAIRLSGQDCQRGTFSQRHAVWVDQSTEEQYLPLAHLHPQQAKFEVWNSPLSEYGVLGFEFGYSLDAPGALVLWEAQFGDFANGAQVVIDQYLAASEQKWQRYSGLVLLLPHGYEGYGAEHSSARLERYLQLCAQNNLQVCYPTTPAQYFHLLRRQIQRAIRLPLIIMAPKGLLRHPECLSPLVDFTQGSFQEILVEELSEATHVICCTGRVYYDLVEQRKKRDVQGTAILRFEQMYPLQNATIQQCLASYPQMKRISWVQEEPSNMGAGPVFLKQLQECCKLPIEFLARPESATTATGSHTMHKKEFEILMQKVFG